MIRWMFAICLSICASMQAHASDIAQEELRIAAAGLSDKSIRVRLLKNMHLRALRKICTQCNNPIIGVSRSL